MERMAVSFVIVILSCYTVQGLDLLLSASLMDKDSTPFTPCDNNTECEDFLNAVCIDHYCECNGTKFCQDKTGTVVTRIGEPCKIAGQCNIEHSVCKEDKCACAEGRVQAANGRKCLKLAEALGSTCEEDIQCYQKVAHSICHNEKCVCEQQMHEYQGVCYRNVALGSDCQLIGECSATNFSTCLALKQQCACQDGYVQSEVANMSLCLEAATKMDGPCQEHIQCSKFRNAHCTKGRCQCADLHQFKLRTSMCVRDALLNENCEVHTDCHGPEQGDSRSECILGKCKCRSEFHEDNGYCASAAIPSVNLPSVLMLLSTLVLRVYFIAN